VLTTTQLILSAPLTKIIRVSTRKVRFSKANRIK